MDAQDWLNFSKESQVLIPLKKRLQMLQAVAVVGRHLRRRGDGVLTSLAILVTHRKDRVRRDLALGQAVLVEAVAQLTGGGPVQRLLEM